MAKIEPDPIGSYQGRVGNISYFMRKSENFARKKSSNVRTSDSAAAVEQRAKFGTLIKLSTLLAAPVNVGFPQRKRGLSSQNTFVSLNKGICKMENDTVIVDFEKLQCANGPLLSPQVVASFDEVGKIITFTSESMEEMVYCNADDQVYAVLLDDQLRGCLMTKLRTRGENGSTSVSFPASWNKASVHVYVFAVRADGRQASISSCIPLEGA